MIAYNRRFCSTCRDYTAHVQHVRHGDAICMRHTTKEALNMEAFEAKRKEFQAWFRDLSVAEMIMVSRDVQKMLDYRSGVATQLGHSA